MKKLRKLFSSNKGNATYYVMVVIMVITIMVSGLLAVSLRSSVVSTNYKTDIESYNKCDSVLQKIKGELRVGLVGKNGPETDLVNWFSNSNSEGKKFLHPYGLTNSEYFYPTESNASIPLQANALLTEEELELLQSNKYVDNCYGFVVSQPQDAKYIVIKDVLVKDGSVGIQTDIKIIMGNNNNYVITDVVFENYKIISVTAEGGDQQ